MAGEQARMVDGAFAQVDNPIVQMLDMEVQHPVSRGPATDQLGSIDVGVIVMPSGQPRIMISLRHPDGTALSGWVPNRETLQEIADMIVEANATAQTILKANARAARQ